MSSLKCRKYPTRKLYSSKESSEFLERYRIIGAITILNVLYRFINWTNVHLRFKSESFYFSKTPMMKSNLGFALPFVILPCALIINVTFLINFFLKLFFSKNIVRKLVINNDHKIPVWLNFPLYLYCYLYKYFLICFYALIRQI